MARQPGRVNPPPYLATVEDQGKLVLAVMMTPPFKLVLYGWGEKWAETCEAVAQDLLQKVIAVPGLLAPKTFVETFARIWIKGIVRLGSGREKIVRYSH